MVLLINRTAKQLPCTCILPDCLRPTESRFQPMRTLLPFDLDQYKILSRHLLRGRPKVVELNAVRH